MLRPRLALARSGCKLVFRKSNRKLYLVNREAWDKLEEEFNANIKRWFYSEPASEGFYRFRELIKKIEKKKGQLLDQSETIEYEEFIDD